MNKKFNEKKMLETAESGLFDLSCEELKEIIKTESEKEYENINTDLIDLCFDILAAKEEYTNAFRNMILNSHRKNLRHWNMYMRCLFNHMNQV